MAVLLTITTEVMQRQAMAHGITLTVGVDDEVPDTALLDRDKIAWAITSLVGSAMRHVRVPGGTIDVRASYDAEQTRLSIAVLDDGPGIPADRLPKLLERAGWRPGSALALLLVEEIATAHGGGLEIESASDRSRHFTRVRVTLHV